MQGKNPKTGKNHCVGEVFSDYVAQLGPGGEPPSLVSLEEVRGSLRGVLVGELRRRGLSQSPPHFLGLLSAKWDREALDELVSDAYVFIFVRRLRGLRDQQKLRCNIRPMVIRNVRNFLTELQKKADPLGYRVFGRLREAVERCIERKELFLLNPKPEAKKLTMNNGSLLSFQPTLAPAAQREDLAESVRQWNDQLLPKLITAEGRAVPKQIKRLAKRVMTLRSEGVAAFHLGDLVAELKSDIRGRWQGIWKGSLGELAREGGEEDERAVNVRVTRPDEEPDWPRRQILIEECVATSIDQQRPLGNRRDLWDLWTLIRTTRLPFLDDEPLPSFTELGRQLRLTRDRVRQLFGRLRPLVLACIQVGQSSRSQESGPQPASAGDLTNDSSTEINRPTGEKQTAYLTGRGR